MITFESALDAVSQLSIDQQEKAFAEIEEIIL